MTQFSFQPLPGFVFRVKVVYHSSHRAMMRAFGDTSGDAETCVTHAFCETFNPRKHRGKLATLNFCQKYYSVDTVAHEATHAVNWLVKQAGLDLEQVASEELTAIAVGEITKAVIDNKPKGW